MRTFTYNAAGRMTQATVFTLTTRFTYNGDGARRVVEVVGQGATTYTVDYARGNRILAEATITSTTLYLYGHDCLGEFRDEEPALSGAEGWLYYLNDGTGYVRQGTDEQGQVTSAWLFDPDGTVLEGPQGPVSHLICGGVYDWSTGLIFKGGRYFDPSLGIWLALTPLVVLQSWLRRERSAERRGRKRKRRGMPWYVVVVLVVVGVGGMLAGCGEVTPPPEGDTPTPTEICTNTPIPPTPTTPPAGPPTPTTPPPTPTSCPEVPEVPGIPTPYTRAGYQLVRDELLNKCPDQVDGDCKIKAQAFIAISIRGEFGGLIASSIYGEALEAMSRQYHSPELPCQGDCDTIEKQIQMARYWEAWGYVGQHNNLQYIMGSGLTEWQNYLDDADNILDPIYQAGTERASWQWGNLRQDSLGDKYLKGELAPEQYWWTGDGPFVAYKGTSSESLPWFVVMTAKQNKECGDVTCSGW